MIVIFGINLIQFIILNRDKALYVLNPFSHLSRRGRIVYWWFFKNILCCVLDQCKAKECPLNPWNFLCFVGSSQPLPSISVSEGSSPNTPHSIENDNSSKWYWYGYLILATGHLMPRTKCICIAKWIQERFLHFHNNNRYTVCCVYAICSYDFDWSALAVSAEPMLGKQLLCIYCWFYLFRVLLFSFQLFSLSNRIRETFSTLCTLRTHWQRQMHKP